MTRKRRARRAIPTKIDYSTRVHLKRTWLSLDWKFMLALVALAIGVVLAIRFAA